VCFRVVRPSCLSSARSAHLEDLLVVSGKESTSVSGGKPAIALGRTPRVKWLLPWQIRSPESLRAVDIETG